MANLITTGLIVGSAVIALLLLIAASVEIDDIKDIKKTMPNPLGGGGDVSLCKISDLLNPLLPIKLPENVGSKLCSALDGTRAAGALGIITALFQLGTCGFLLFKNMQDDDASSLKMLKLIIYGIIFVLSIITFSVGIHYYNQTRDIFKTFKDLLTPFGYNLGELTKDSKYQFLNAMSGLDWIFSLGMIVLTVVLKD